MALVACSDICVPKEEGGLSLKQLITWNKAAVGSQLWKVISDKKCLWNTRARKVYFKGHSIWAVGEKNDDPWTWRKLLKIRGSFRLHTRTIIGDGRHTKLFYDSWLQSGPLRDTVDHDIKLWGGKMLVAEWRQQERWMIPTSFKRKFPIIVQEMETHRLSSQIDINIWTLSTSGTYSIASFYDHFITRNTKVTWSRLVCSRKIPQKYRFILWLLMRQRLKTRDLLV